MIVPVAALGLNSRKQRMFRVIDLPGIGSDKADLGVGSFLEPLPPAGFGDLGYVQHNYFSPCKDCYKSVNSILYLSPGYR
jgi:hypothetical protein